MVIKTFFAKFKMYFMIAGALALIIGTWQVQEWRHDAKRLDAVEKAVENYKSGEEDRKQVAIDLALKQTKKKIVYRKQIKEVIKYVKSPIADRECLDASGVHLWNSINRGEASSVGRNEKEVP